ncbi:MAG TPA: AI-2E family transporter [Burkholderiales bacterium]
MASTVRAPRNERIFLTVLAVLGTLWFAEDVLVPLALAILLSFLLAPVASRLQTWGLPRVLSVLATALVAFALLGGVMYVVGSQFLNLAQSLPDYKTNLVKKIHSLRTPAGGGLQEGTETVKELTEELQKATPGNQQATRGIQKVQVVNPPSSAIQIVRDVLGPILKPLGTGAVVVVFVIFMLLEREDLRDRVIRLVGVRDLHTTTQAMDDAAGRVSRYLMMQTLINAMQGVAVATGLWLIGVPNAMLWGALTTVLRFIPYIGPWLAAIMPIALAFAVFDGWTFPLLTIGLFVVLELFSNNVLEPWLYGTSTGVSQLALLVAAVFWTWLWGTAGLFLSTPLTVCLVVMGKYIPQLEFFSILLSDEPVLKPKQRFYQRLLARDPEEAEELIDEAREEQSLLEIFDTMVIPALVLAEQDHQRGVLEETTRQYIIDQTRELGDDLCDEEEKRRRDANAPALLSNGARFSVLNLPAADEADEVAAHLFARQLALEGIESQLCSVATLKSEMLNKVEEMQPDMVCISALPPAAMVHARYLCKRLHARFPDLPIVVGLWSALGDMEKARERLEAVGCGKLVASYTEGMEEMTHRLQPVLQGVKRNGDAAVHEEPVSRSR